MRLLITRHFYGKKQVIGTAQVGGLVLRTLELPWRNNKKDESCIKEGIYSVKKITRESNGEPAFLVEDVKGRDEILIHSGNFNYDTKGCILVGTGLRDLNSDGLPDVTYSKNAVKSLMALEIDKIEITSKDPNKPKSVSA